MRTGHAGRSLSSLLWVAITHAYWARGGILSCELACRHLSSLSEFQRHMHTGHAGRSCGLTVAHLDPAGWTLTSRHMRIGRTGRSLDVCSLPVTHAYWARGAVLAVVLLHRDLSWIHPSSSNLDWLVRDSVSLINPGINPSLYIRECESASP